MKKRIASFLAMAFLVGASLFGGAMPVMADAFNDGVCNDVTIPDETKKAAGCSETRTIWGSATDIINVVIAVAGVICVFVIVICGIQMTVSAGDPVKASKAKKGILYAVIGLLITILAWALVNFVLSNL